MKKLALLIAVAVAFAGAAERYKDRMFDVSVERDVTYASGVKHLKTVNSLLKAYNLYATVDDGMPVHLYENETDLTEVSLTSICHRHILVLF